VDDKYNTDWTALE